ncbi:MAG: VTT domain-containing protein [Acidobacteriia bacterium]|nr:VTT domain-containing protein [Terriglobia bacterium]
MDHVLHLLDRYGYAIIFASVFFESLGLPIPAFPFLLAAGAASMLGSLNLAIVLLTAVIGMLIGDTILYILGRLSGWRILGFLCKVSASPETCILRSAESFYKRGRITLVVAKYIPGINTMAPPLAGSLKMKLRQFLALDLLGSLLYIVPFLGVGYFFSRGIESVVNSIHSLGQIFLWLFVLALFGYAIRRFRIYSKNRLYREVPRVSVQELAGKLSDPNLSTTILIADARSHGYYEEGSQRIKGSIRIEPASISEQFEKLPRDKEIYLYCT